MLFEIFKTPAGTIKDFILVSSLLALVDRPIKNSANWEDMNADDVSNLEIDADDILKIINEEVRERFDSFAISSTESGNKSIYGAAIWTNMAGEREIGNFSRVKFELEKEIKSLSFRKIIEPEKGHREAFLKVLRKIIEEFESEINIQLSRTITLWLLMLARDMDKGDVSPNKSALIDGFRTVFQIEDDIFEDLQERAQVLHQELSKTMTIINE